MKRLPIADEDLRRFCERHGILRLSLFGSALHGTVRAESDIDLLVEFEPGRKPGLLALAAMEKELSAKLGGKRVDLRTAQDLSRHFRDEVYGAPRCSMRADDRIGSQQAMEAGVEIARFLSGRERKELDSDRRSFSPSFACGKLPAPAVIVREGLLGGFS